MDFQLTWFILWGVLWAAYFMLDGFVLGTGMLHLFLPKSETEKQITLTTVGPVWDGNEVWLVTAGGATFAAFPGTYALMFSYLYSALLLLLFGLIIRGVSLEFRNYSGNPAWKRWWDLGWFLGSLLPALLFGVAFGNIFRGLPMDQAGYHGSLVYLLNPYGLLTGALFVLLFLVHGSLYLAVKAEGALGQRAETLARRLWIPLLIVSVLFLVATALATRLDDNYRRLPVLLVFPLLAVAALLSVRWFLARQAPARAFFASCVTVLMVVGTGVAGLFPNLIPSNLDPAFSLTIANSSSSPYTLKIMTVVAFVFIPIIIAYKSWVYRVFRGKVTAADVESHPSGY